MDPGLGGKVFLVTGGTRGIGLATTRVLLQEGAYVLVAARTTHSIDRARAELAEYPRVDFVEADLRNADGGRHAVAAAAERFGPLDGVVNNASGFSIDHGHPDREAWLELFELKVLGYEAVIQAALDHLRDGGSIVNISGIASMRYWPLSPHVSAINSAVEALTRHYAAALVDRRIRVNTVVPGTTATDRYEGRVERARVQAGVDAETARKRIDSTVPLGRPVDPAEIAATVVFLSSRLSASTTGATAVVDGGAVVVPDSALPSAGS
ncbi:SDR family NAD(P)-dependent oxidoreductase [Nocardia testacea]|uniref:SDR family NAD(P)-dependent oxidoreductase n=1 Tax=Nocardia testacea TaxID=248551 RepID=UPI00031EEF0D|nr:SDR family oxidoreductase [Nocardia testacea]